MEESKGITIRIDAKLKNFQKTVLNTLEEEDTKILLVNCSRQIGKSFVCRFKILQWLAVRDTTIGYCCPTNRLGKEFYTKMLQIIPNALIKYANSIELRIGLKNGSRILFFSNESISTVRGFTLDYLIIDETAFCKRFTTDGQDIYYNILSPLLDVKGKKQLWLSTPNGTGNNLFYEFYQKAQQKVKGIRYLHFTVYDDETKTPEWIEDKKASLPSAVWQQEYLGKFLEEGVSYFKNYSSLFNLHKFNYLEKIYVGIDFSSVGSDETIVTFINLSNEVIQFKIDGSLDDKYDKIAQLLNENDRQIERICAEKNSIGSPMINEIKKKLGSVKYKLEERTTTNTTKNEDINLLAYHLEQGTVHFMADNVELKEQFGTYVSQKTKSGMITFNALSGYHDDRIMSLALAMSVKNKNDNPNRKYAVVFRR